MRKFQTIAWAIVLLAVAVQAEDSARTSAQSIDSRTLSVQDKVEELFERGEFERAYNIYRNDLAPVGDKYAQYMVGYMHLMGLGVREDVVDASAWYRLAAERGYPEFVAVRNQVLQSLEDDELLRSDQVFIELRRNYSDVVLTIGLLRKDLEDTSGRVTGSRLSGRSGAVTIVNPNSGVGMSGDNFYRKREVRMKDYLATLTERLGVDREGEEIDDELLDELQVLVDEYLLRIDDR